MVVSSTTDFIKHQEVSSLTGKLECIKLMKLVFLIFC